jgi:hypothetical protein
MKRLINRIGIYDQTTGLAKLIFPSIVNVEIVSSRFEFTDTATVEFSELTYQQNNKISDLIKKGDRIVIELGYFEKNDENYGYITEFDGYVSEIIPTSPIQLKCQDEMYILKQDMIETKVFKSTNLKELISYYYKGETVIDNADIGDWVIGRNSTLVDVFDELKSKLGILTYFQNKVLYCNAELIKKHEKTVLFDINENVPIDTDQISIENQGNYKLVVHGLSPQKNGTKVERFCYYKDIGRTQVEVSSDKPEGVLNLVEIPNITQAELDNLIKKRLPKLYEGVTSGEIQTFGQPSFKHSDRAVIRNSKDESVNGTFDIVGVIKRFGVSGGYKQTAKIGLRIT